MWPLQHNDQRHKSRIGILSIHTASPDLKLCVRHNCVLVMPIIVAVWPECQTKEPGPHEAQPKDSSIYIYI